MTAPSAAAELELRTRRRIAARLLPFLFILYVIAFLDRVNISSANLEMSRALSFSDSVFGFGSGIFFVGYFLLEIPGCLIVERWSARVWIARIMVSWGITTILMAFIRTPMQFYTVRVLLGAAEAGFFPGILVYLTHWFRYEDRAKAGALFMTAIPISYILGSPLSGWLLGARWFGIPGWRWLFIVEGIPAVVFGIVTALFLTDWPRQARWLPADGREWITTQLEKERAAKAALRMYTVWQALRNREVVRLTVVYFFAVSSIYALTIWLPTFLKRASGKSDFVVTLLATVPFLAALVAMLINGWHSDHTRERRWHTAVPLLLSAAAFLLLILSGRHFWLVFTFVSLAAISNSFLPSFWALPSALLSDSAAAASIGLINSIGNLGSFASPYIIGYFLDRTHSFTPGFLYVVASMVFSALLVVSVRMPNAGKEMRA